MSDLREDLVEKKYAAQKNMLGSKNEIVKEKCMETYKEQSSEVYIF